MFVLRRIILPPPTVVMFFFFKEPACLLCSLIGFDRCSAVIDECILLWNLSHNIVLEDL